MLNIVKSPYLNDQEALLSQRGRTILRVCIASIQNVERCQGYVPLTLDVVRVAFKVPLAFHTPL